MKILSFIAIAFFMTACHSANVKIVTISVKSEWCNHEKNKACLRRKDDVCEISISSIEDFASISTMKELCRKGTL